MLKRLFPLMLLALCSMSVLAQTGSIRGVVTDANSNETIIGANVLIEGTSQGAATDLDGGFEITQIQPGTYNLKISFISYKSVRLEGLQVAEGKVTSVNLQMEEDADELGEVVVTAARETSTQMAVISEMRRSLNVVSGISSDQIKLSQDRDAAQAMSRVPGITIVNNRFVMVRGVPERYNQVMINNAIAPSTEIDRRTFSFDLIPSQTLDRMLIFKSGSPENPGDFSGGLIKLYTKNAFTEDFTQVNFGIGVRQGTTFNQYLQAAGSGTDFFGFDNGLRNLPAGFPDTRTLQGTSRFSELRETAGKSLRNDFQPAQSQAIPDMSAGISFGKNFELKGPGSLSTVTSFNISQSYQQYGRDFFRYFTWENREAPILRRFAFQDATYEKDNRVGIISNWNYRINAFNRIEFKNLFNQIGENTTVVREGYDYQQFAGNLRRNYMLQYRSRTLLTSQLEGTHQFPASKSSLNWVMGFNYIAELEPDLRRFRTIQFDPASGSESPFSMILPPSSNLFDTGRYWGELAEQGFSNGLNFEKILGGDEDKPRKLKAGYLAEFRNRTFDARYINYLYPGGGNDPAIGEQIRTQPLDQIFSPENIRRNNGLVIEEGTRPVDSYTASNLLTAGYLSLVYPVGLFNFSGGARMEYNVQEVNSANEIGPFEITNPVFSPLGFLNVDYSVAENTLVRFGYGKTVNRPEFREIAPFQYYDFRLEATVTGNPDLKVADIHNVDLRIETYPRPGETISFGVFYKYFLNPIEAKIVVQTESPGFAYGNAERAYNYGAEIEVRKSFQDVFASSFLNRFQVNLNASLIHSQVDFGPGEDLSQDQKRPLQGQSPYIVNAGLVYDDVEKGFQVGAAYNVFGQRIYAVGNYLFPTIFELPRHALDLTVSKQLSEKLTLKAGVQDVLNAPYRFFENSTFLYGSTSVDPDVDSPIFQFRRGTLFTTSISYLF
ncbi:MAG: outer membrane beta-barrel protein [Lunatimonas sp.]|uniref:TonB-dependent receptor n=1 Tax=Lunatimonas sp. TaxID=2060141 RepID=UPI00263AD49B|nr:TonB-dependent receptor [Lunatimonas sp.]MCC5937455.1 outer membrane beta-barrel protein [Lunatimonas sp.]